MRATLAEVVRVRKIRTHESTRVPKRCAKLRGNYALLIPRSGVVLLAQRAEVAATARGIPTNREVRCWSASAPKKTKRRGFAEARIEAATRWLSELQQ